jgi:hypothetical protein
VTLADLLPDTLGRLEENEEGGPIFFNQTYEILPTLVDGMFEAALLTGTVQAVNQLVTLAAGTTYFSLQNNAPIGIPAGVICALRMKAPSTIRKTTLKGLSDMQPGWQNAAPLPPTTRGPSIISWFPLGVSAFGIYPQLAAESTVNMDFIVSPVTVPRPYTPAIAVPFQEEFASAFPEYSATMCRAKELGAEAEEADTVYTEYLDKMKRLSMFQNRLDSLVWTGSSGAKSTVTRKEVL